MLPNPKLLDTFSLCGLRYRNGVTLTPWRCDPNLSPGFIVSSAGGCWMGLEDLEALRINKETLSKLKCEAVGWLNSGTDLLSLPHYLKFVPKWMKSPSFPHKFSAPFLFLI